jgi:hypothetical protein
MRGCRVYSITFLQTRQVLINLDEHLELKNEGFCIIELLGQQRFFCFFLQKNITITSLFRFKHLLLFAVAALQKNVFKVIF